MIDTHSHIYGPEFDEDREEVVLRAQQAGVEMILLPNINGETIYPMLSLSRRFPGFCFPMMGLHPTDLEDDYLQVLDRMHALLLEPGHPYIAVGEVGLDFYWDTSRYDQQLDAFEKQIQWAEETDLPLMIHARSAQKELVEVMSRHKDSGLKGVFHCFGGTREEAEELLQFDGFVLGIGGVLTYKKSTLPDALSVVPLDRVVLETDSPYLAPVPHRGKRNESAYVADVARKMAELYQVPFEEVTRRTNDNVRRVFASLNSLISASF